MGGVVVSYELGRQLGKEAIFTERKNNIMELRRGFEVKPGDRIIIAEDVVTTGKSTKETKKVLEELGGQVIGVACIANRTKDDGACPLCDAGQIDLVKPGSREFKNEK